MFTKIQAMVPFEGPRSFDQHMAQLDVDTDEGEIRIVVHDRKMAAEVIGAIEGMRDDFELKVDLDIVRKKS